MKCIAPYRLAARKESLDIELASDQLARFILCVVQADAWIRGKLDFAVVNRDVCQVSGWLKTKAWLQCQRCLELQLFEISVDVDLYIARTEKATTGLTRTKDLLVVEALELELAELIEDDLIMALPMAPKHEDCKSERLCSNQPSKLKSEPEEDIRR